jgi:SRSO17 transposase
MFLQNSYKYTFFLIVISNECDTYRSNWNDDKLKVEYRDQLISVINEEGSLVSVLNEIKSKYDMKKAIFLNRLKKKEDCFF